MLIYNPTVIMAESKFAISVKLWRLRRSPLVETEDKSDFAVLRASTILVRSGPTVASEALPLFTDAPGSN